MEIGTPALSLTNSSNTHAVRHLQTLLNEHGASLYVDGRFAIGTQRALSAFQVEHKIEPSGFVCEDTWAKLDKPKKKAPAKKKSPEAKKEATSPSTKKKAPAKKKPAPKKAASKK